MDDKKIPFIEQLKMKLHLGAYREIRRLSSLEEDARSPVMVMVGSLTDCTYKDAVAYVRGLADKYVMSQTTSWFRIMDDRTRGRYVYEIHDGGVGLSIIESMLAELDDGKKVHIKLANNGYVTIEQEHDQLFSLLVSDAEDVYPTQSGELVEPMNIVHYATETRMRELYPQNKALFAAGAGILSVSMVAFSIAAAAYVATASGVLKDDVLTARFKDEAGVQIKDNPIEQLKLAKLAARASDSRIKRLYKLNNNWLWELEKQ